MRIRNEKNKRKTPLARIRGPHLLRLTGDLELVAFFFFKLFYPPSYPSHSVVLDYSLITCSAAFDIPRVGRSQTQRLVAAPHYRVLRWAAPQGFRETIEEAIDVADGARVGKPLPVLLGCGRTVCAIHPKRFHMCIFLFGSFSVVFTFEHFVTKTRAVAGRRITRQSVVPPIKRNRHQKPLVMTGSQVHRSIHSFVAH